MTLSRRIDALLHHQLARWEEAGRSPTPTACVAIASLPGAGGGELGQRVAEQLGFACFGREIVDQIAARRGIPEEILRGLDGRVRSAVDRYFTDTFQEQRFTEDEFLKEVERFVIPLARRGSAVFVGRGSAFLLAHAPALRVLTVAPAAFRIERFGRESGLTGEAAREALRQEDEARSAFIRRNFHERIDDPSAYDVSVNVASLGLEAAAADVAEIWRRRYAHR